jgi:hypothetical protein
MTELLLPVVVGAMCYGLSTAFEIRFTSKTTVPTAAALAPAVCLVAMGGHGDYAYLLALAPAAAALSLLVTRRPFDEIVLHVALFGLVAATVQGLGMLGLEDPLARALVGGTEYLLGQYSVQRVRMHSPLLAHGDRKTWLLLHGVLICACGLTALGVGEMDWPAFIAMALVLVLTKREFEAFALSRTAYEQTVQAVERLKSLEAPRA